jgi:hypothetical protein
VAKLNDHRISTSSRFSNPLGHILARDRTEPNQPVLEVESGHVGEHDADVAPPAEDAPKRVTDLRR